MSYSFLSRSRLSRSRLLVSIVKSLRDSLRSLFADLLSQKRYQWLSITTLEDKDYLQRFKYFAFGSDETIRVDTPPVTDDAVTWEFKGRLGEYVVPAPKVAAIKHVELVGPHATGFDAQGGLIWETALPQFYGVKPSISVRSLAQKFKSAMVDRTHSSARHVELAASLLNPWHTNYFHWCLDCLTKLEGIEHFSKMTGLNPQIIIGSQPTRWQLESLSLLGYSSEQLIRWPSSANQLRVDQLVVSSFRRASPQGISPSVCRFLRDRCLANISEHSIAHADAFSKRVLISRRKANRRRVVNEEELADALAPLGFQTYVLEDLSFADQVRLFAQAEFVIGPHGAGMTNMIFAHDLSVVEFFSGNCSYFQPIFFSLSQALNFRHGYVVGEKERLGNLSHVENICIDPQKMLSVVKRLL